jgi:hypothetical protein
MRPRGDRSHERAGTWSAIALCVLALAGCGPATTSGTRSQGVVATAGPSASHESTITNDPSASLAPEVACELTQAPGPGDVPAAGGETDTSELGGGRWRICLQAPLATAAEASALCRWDHGHATVSEISGLPATSGTVDYDAWLSFGVSAFEFHATDTAHGGLIANYGPDAAAVVVRLDGDGRGGFATFDVGLLPDPDSVPPIGASPRYVGVVRWRCGDAPPGA